MIQINDIVTLLQQDHLLQELTSNGSWHYSTPDEMKSLTFEHITYDSRDVAAHTLFICKGNQFKRAFLESAIEQGATAYIAEQDYEVSIPGIIVTDVRKAMALVAMAFYGYPQNDLKIIAYTGTKGKTTSAYFCKAIMDQATHYHTALLSTMETYLDGRHAQKSLLTTPESLDLFKMMRQAVDYGMTHLIMEVSSQAYKLNRVYGLTFDIGIMLNLSPDHIGPIEHPTYDDYMYCKSQLIENSRLMILNHDMSVYDYFLEKSNAYHVPTITYGRHTGDATYEPKQQGYFDVEDKRDKALSGEYRIRLLGDFNQSNALSAMLACHELGATAEDIRKGLEKAVVPGRMERLEKQGAPVVYVDYAHNYLSASSLLQFIKEEHPNSQLYVVLGSTGNKAESRREGFGKVLSEYADVAVLTSDDPEFEDPEKIMDEIEAAMPVKKEVVRIVDRKEAIHYAIDRATEQDVVVLAGKGRDEYQHINGERVPYEGDVAIAKKYLGIESEK